MDLATNKARALLTGGKTKKEAWKYLECLDHQLRDLQQAYSKNATPDYFLGGLGASLFYHNLFQVTQNSEHKKKCQSFFKMAYGAIGEISVADNWYGGIAGAAWLAEHLKREKGRKWPPGQDPHLDFDRYLISKIKKASSLGAYWLVGEWVGYGAYALERFPNGKSREILESLVKFLAFHSKKSPQGRAWFTPKSVAPSAMRKKLRSGFYNLGVARGIPGVIGFLSEALKKGISEKITRPLLEESVAWFLDQDHGQHYPLFIPHNCIIGRAKKVIPPFGWCHGDLGIAPVLINAGQALQNDRVERRGLEIGLRACRFTKSTAGVEGPLFCHGASGIVHIFNRLYQMTGKEIFRQKALFWANDLFDRLQVKLPFGYSLIEGQTGIGLCLLSAISNKELHWDRPLMVSFS